LERFYHVSVRDNFQTHQVKSYDFARDLSTASIGL
jgi:hypothetical protein